MFSAARRKSRRARSSIVAGLVSDEIAVPKISERLLDLGPRVHHERSVAGDRLAERPRGGEEEPATASPGRGHDGVAVAEHDQRRRANNLLLGPEPDLSVVEIRERG